MDFTSPYLTQQIIAYIGNKRKLLPLIFEAIESSGIDAGPGTKFFDVFAGSGAVSRLAKSLGCEVYANDWEPYSQIINSCYIATDESDIARLFGGRKEFLSLLEEINALPEPGADCRYIADYYAPSSFDIDEADFKTERLFYTRQNALSIDKIRNRIEELYPPADTDRDTVSRRNILIAELLYECATHTNTSGVFKSCHKGFGGHNRDALKRILSPIRLREPVLIDSPYHAHILKCDANEIVDNGTAGHVDIAYLDPPYNQHQYGSNYHLLNSIALWDRIPEPLDLDENGELREKAAIRHDWIKTRSRYCYRKTAAPSFADLLDNLDADRILVSYSTDGIIPFEQMQEICARRGRLSIVTNEYTTYRGGKQSNSRLDTNIEFILCIDTTHKPDSGTLTAMDDLLMRRRFLLLFRRKFRADLVSAKASRITEDGTAVFTCRGTEISVPSDRLFTLYPPDSGTQLAPAVLHELYETLSSCACGTKEEELRELLAILRTDSACPARLTRRIPETLKKLASRKNRDAFEYWLAQVRNLEHEAPAGYAKIRSTVDKVEKIAQLRFTT